MNKCLISLNPLMINKICKLIQITLVEITCETHPENSVRSQVRKYREPMRIKTDKILRDLMR